MSINKDGSKHLSEVLDKGLKESLIEVKKTDSEEITEEEKKKKERDKKVLHG